MRLKKLFLILLLILCSGRALSAVFVVTSNADSGPGTLREALTLAAANGSAEKDFINFNLPGLSLAGRTIALKSQLPDVSSNLVIDGTTQPGNKFGVSDAKVKITNTFVNLVDLNTFYSNGGDLIEIYGLWLWNDMNGWGGSAFHFRNFGAITIGAPSKGNLVEWGNIGIDTGKVCYFQSNICWTDTTGEVSAGGNMGIIGCSKLTIGGSVNAGNTFAGFLDIFFTDAVNTSEFEISYNNMGADRTGLVSPYSFYVENERLVIRGTSLDNGQPASEAVNGLIKNNVLANIGDASLLQIGELKGKIIIQGNAFNTDFAGKTNFSVLGPHGPFQAIGFTGVADIIVGGDDPSQKNIMAYCDEGINYTPQGKFLVTKNSIFCYSDSALYITRPGSPYVKIASVTNTNINGTATPKATIELYNADCSCTVPGPKDYFSTITADDNGKWAYNGPVNGYIMASATLDSLTGSFTGLNIDDSKVVILNSTCNATGSITGIKTQFTTGFKWFNSKNESVGTDLDLKNVPPDTYTLKIDYGTTCELTKTYVIQDYSIKVDTSKIKLIKPTCNTLGSITGINVSSQSPQPFYQWLDQSGKIVCNCTDFYYVGPGTYTFMVGNTDGTCSQSFGPFVMNNTNGPNIDESKAVITATNCGQSTGGISNLSATGAGTLKYIWYNSLHVQIGANKDLTNQPAGTYELQVIDDNQCGVYSSTIQIPETNGVKMDEANVKTSGAACSSSSGYITGIVVTGATKYQWANGGIAVGDAADLKNVGPGDYVLTASNDFGCRATSQTYHIAQQTPVPFPVYSSSITPSCFGDNSGAVSVTADALVKNFRWVNSQGQNAGTDATLSKAPAGVYQLYLTDQNGCESYYNSYTVTQIAEFTVTAPGEVKNDQCGLKGGSISAATITGGVLPYAYKWTDAGGNRVGTAESLTNLAAGKYSLNVNDSRCGTVAISYTVSDQADNIPTPSVNNVALCSPGNAIIIVNNAAADAIYRLYDTQDGLQPIDEQKNGRFNITVTGNRLYYVSEVDGTCEGARTEVKVTVGLSALSIANAFTPNGDGINDYWKINGIENYPNATIQIFTRNGQNVFSSTGYAHPFDGTLNGKKLPTGVYYYVINLNNSCKLLSGSLTIIR